MKVTVVIDNSIPAGAPGPYLAEHGLSLLIDYAGKLILLDTGQTGNAVHNLSLLGIHPEDLDVIVLSHGHYDHTGGIRPLLKHRKKSVPVYAHPDLFNPRFSVKGGGRHYIGMPYSCEELATLGAEWRFSAEPLELTPGLWFSGQIPRETLYEKGDSNLVVESDCGCCTPDPIQDDIALYYRDPDKNVVVISGCAHSGFENSVRHALGVTGSGQWKGWIGGTHLGSVAIEQLEQSLAFIDTMNPQFIAANHCTGFAVMALLQRKLEKRFIPAFVGTVIKC